MNIPRISKRRAAALRAAALGVLIIIIGIAAVLSPGPALQPVEPVPVVRPRPPPSPLGLRVVELDAAQTRALGVGGAVRVVHVIGQAYASGLRVDDVIVAVNGKAVTGFEPFWDAVAAADWQPALDILRDGKPLTMRIEAVQRRARTTSSP